MTRSSSSGPLRERATSHVKMTTIFSRAGTAAGGTRASKVAAARRSRSTQIMPHCCKRSSSMRPEGRSGNGSGDKRIPADTAKRNVVDAKHGVVAKDDERITTTKPGRSR
ncbi:hypothetical protein ALC53_10106 [Atta colombica]|uniref:Uncharacterized protein n=1 Tax=Atta colombica TaxID=520822 RepID=A0A151I1Q9_9HYME|nr:hypothetical protein ALC53_10106 [Atta colombica]